MDKGIYTALSGAMAKSHEIDLLANNLANANTTGFKKDTGTFSEYVMELRRPDTPASLHREIEALTNINGRPPGDKSFVEMDGVYTDHSQGTIRQTGRLLDFAINGNGYFEINTPSGALYTRQGNLALSPEGKLVTLEGHPVLSPGEGDPKDREILLPNGNVQVAGDGQIYLNGSKIAELKVQQFHESQWLEKVGNAHFRNTDVKNFKTEDLERIEVLQGFIEGSNVNPIREMTRLIQATRSYEAHMQTIKTFQTMDNRSVNDIARY